MEHATTDLVLETFENLHAGERPSRHGGAASTISGRPFSA